MVYGSSASGDEEIALLTRSILEILSDIASTVEVPPEHLAEKRVSPTMEPEGDGIRGPLIRIHVANERSEDEFASAPYRNRWFWIDDRDYGSKKAFLVPDVRYDAHGNRGQRGGAGADDFDRRVSAFKGFPLPSWEGKHITGADLFREGIAIQKALAEEAMTGKRRKSSRSIATVAALTAALLLASCLAPKQEQTPVAAVAAPPQEKAPAAPVEKQDAQAMETLMRMSRYLAGTQSYSVSIDSNYDAIQESGERIEFAERRRILLHRPDRARVEVERSDGDRGLLLFDGKQITAFKSGDNVYATVEQPATVDLALVYLVRDLQVTLPLARLFLTTLPEELEKRVESVAFVETETLFNVPVDHLAARTVNVNFQVWVAQGAQPLPRRIVITYRDVPGQPQFRADLFDWNVAPQVTADRFAFTPPAGAEKVPFLAPVRAPSQAPPKKGGAQ